jgi:hypothetical protein
MIDRALAGPITLYCACIIIYHVIEPYLYRNLYCINVGAGISVTRSIIPCILYMPLNCTTESNQAKQREKAPFLPEGETPRTKISPLGQSLWAPGAHLFVDVCWTLVAEEPHRPTILNLEHCLLKPKANVSCLIFPPHQGKMSSAQPLSGLDSPSQGSRGQLASILLAHALLHALSYIHHTRPYHIP